MRARRILATLYATMILTGCIHVDSPSPAGSEFTYDERDAIPAVVPLPDSKVYQRPQLGTKTMLVTVTHWQDGSGLNFELVKKHTLSADPDSLRSYISAASGGKMALTGQVIQHTSGPRPEICKTGSPMPIGLAAEEGHKTARANGLDADKFDFFISVIDCGGNASAWVPGRFFGVYGQAGSPHLYKHEFGHSLGYQHGSTYTGCPETGGAVTAPTGCSTVGYGDTGDSVSGGGTLYPANDRWYSGWLDSSQAPVISASGLYRLARVSSFGPQLYLINRPGLAPTQLALEYRNSTPFDNFPPDDNRVNGVWIRFTSMATSLTNTQLDATPQTTTTADPTLLPGKRFKDDKTGTSIQVCSADAVGATMAVSLNNEPMPSCTPSLPSPIFSLPRANQQVASRPLVSGTGLPGTAVKISRVDGHDLHEMGEAVVGPDGKWFTQLSQPLEPGVRSLVAQTTNPGSEPSGHAISPRFTVATTLAAPTMRTPLSNATTGNLPRFTGTGLPGATVTIERTRDGYLVGAIATALVDADGNWTAQSVAELAAGSNTVSGYQVDGDRKSPLLSSRTFNVGN